MYLCGMRYEAENQLIEHYNSSHSDLVKLGLTLVQSKEAIDSDSDVPSNPNIFNPKGICKPGVDGDLEHDSDLEDLYQMEQFLLEKKRLRDERKLLRRQNKRFEDE